MAIYDTEALTYDQWYTTPIGNFIDELQSNLVFNQFEINAGMKILDVGCGTGNQSIKLAKKGCVVSGIDISKEMLNKAETKKKNLTVSFQNMAASSLDFPDNYFDAVISVTAFEFIKDTEQAFAEMLRVAKKDAPIIIGTLNRDSAWGDLYGSKKFKENSIFKYANLIGMSDIELFSPEKLINITQCLFISPKEKEYTIKNETKFSKVNTGGFICALWKK